MSRIFVGVSQEIPEHLAGPRWGDGKSIRGATGPVP
jgi:hypothetical protein